MTMRAMNTVEEIEKAIEALPSVDFARLATWVERRDMETWKQQMDCDASAGRLDFLFAEAEQETRAAVLRDWPKPE